MNKEQIKRLSLIEKRIIEICKENGLITTNINFEIVTAERMIEALAYRLPTNFSHWSFGKNFEKEETSYRHTGGGIPYEVVWNFNNPTALLVDTNPFALNVLVVAHVFGHVDFHLSNIFQKQGRKITDVIIEARNAKKRFIEYESKYGVDEVEKVIDAAFSFQYHQDPDPFSDDLTEEEIRERLLKQSRFRLNELNNKLAVASSPKEHESIKNEIAELKKNIDFYETQTPPLPEYDILRYLIQNSPKMKKDWVRDVVTVVREQMRAILPNIRTKLINEGWATYWHTKILRQLAKEKLITTAEHEEAIGFHAKVVRKNRLGFNVYCIGPAFWEMVEERWDKGKFGPEWESCKERSVRQDWDKKLGLGRKKILELRKILSDRVAVQNYFDDDFIRDEEIYIWRSRIDERKGEEIFEIVEDRPAIIRQILLNQYTNFGIPNVFVVDGNFGGKGELLLKHSFSGFELNPKYENGALEKLYFLWERPVHLITYEIESYDEQSGQYKIKEIIHSFDGVRHTIK